MACQNKGRPVVDGHGASDADYSLSKGESRVELGQDVSTVSLGKIAESLRLSVGFFKVGDSDPNGDVSSK